jgi:hypothetical protein
MSKHLTPKFASDGKHECQNCGKVWDASLLNDICDIGERIAVGEAVPSGECPICDALCHPVSPKKKNGSKPRILVAVCGGVVQSVRSTTPVKVEVWDEDNLKAEGMDTEACDKDWEKKLKDYPVEDFPVES